MKPAHLLPAMACATACLLSSCDTTTGYVRQLEQSPQGISQSSPGTSGQSTRDTAPSATGAIQASTPSAKSSKTEGHSAGTITVNSTGYGPNEDTAIRDACNNAVKEAFGFLLDGKSVLKNGELTEDIKALSSGVVEKYIVNRRSSEGQLIKAEITAIVKKGGLYQAFEATKISKRGVDGKALGTAIGQEIAREDAFVDIYTRIIGEYLPNAISVEVPEGGTEIIDKTAVAIRVSVKVSANAQAKAMFRERLELLLDQAATKKQRLSVSCIPKSDKGSMGWFVVNGENVSATASANEFPFSTESATEGIEAGSITRPKDSLLGKESIAFAQCMDSYTYFENKNPGNNPLNAPSMTVIDDDGEDGTIYFLSESMFERAIAARRAASVSYIILVQAVDENGKALASAKIRQSDRKGNDWIYLSGEDFRVFAPGFLLTTFNAPRFLPLGSLQVCKTLKIAPADIFRLQAFHASVLPANK